MIRRSKIIKKKNKKMKEKFSFKKKNIKKLQNG